LSFEQLIRADQSAQKIAFLDHWPSLNPTFQSWTIDLGGLIVTVAIGVTVPGITTIFISPVPMVARQPAGRGLLIGA